VATATEESRLGDRCRADMKDRVDHGPGRDRAHPRAPPQGRDRVALRRARAAGVVGGGDLGGRGARARAPNPLRRGVDPERHEDRRIDGRPTRTPLHRTDPGGEGREIQPLDEVSDPPGAVILGQQPVQVRAAPLQRVADRHLNAGTSARSGPRGRRRHLRTHGGGIRPRKQRFLAPPPRIARDASRPKNQISISSQVLRSQSS